MRSVSSIYRFAFVILILLGSFTCQADAADVVKLTSVVNQIGPKGEGHDAARTAMAELIKTDVDEVTLILKGFNSDNKLALNWLRAAADTVLENADSSGKKLPVEALTEFLDDTSQDANARRVAYEWITFAKPELQDEILAKSLNDPSLEIRRDAIASAIQKAQEIEKSSSDDALKHLRNTLGSARDIDQIDEITEQIEQLGGTVDLPTHFGFLMKWNLIGPFDNSGTQGFDVAYAPESGVDLEKSAEGKSGAVKWFQYTTDDRYGLVDLNSVMPEKYKGAIVYAHTTFTSDEQRSVELRLGCINGNKIWVNGKLITSNHVYHANTSIDQYIAKAQLKKGTNEILIKVAQNEQEESWAQRWQFQLRVCDQYGTAILSTDRN